MKTEAKSTETTEGVCAHLLQTSALRAHKSDAVAIVDVGNHRRHTVPSLSEERVASDQLRTAERLVDVQTTEGVIDGNRLHAEGKKNEKKCKPKKGENKREFKRKNKCQKESLGIRSEIQ